MNGIVREIGCSIPHGFKPEIELIKVGAPGIFLTVSLVATFMIVSAGMLYPPASGKILVGE